MEHQEIMHLWHRAGFGPPLTRLQDWYALSRKQAVEKFINDSRDWEPMDVAEKPKTPLFSGKDPNSRTRHLRHLNLDELARMNIDAMNHLAFSSAQLREKMFLFWHGYFACFVPYSYLLQIHINLLRKHALGNFRTLLQAVAKDPAMLEFLNASQNRKAHPNENFARELMELYTLGRGHYSENDIQQAALAFTGWTYDENAVFYQIPEEVLQHEIDFRGRKGIFSGEDIINLLLEDSQTAIHICTRLYKFFVNYEDPHAERIQELAQVLISNDYEIIPVLEAMFAADWFYGPDVVGRQIKSPVELITGMRRQLGITFKDEQVLLFLQRMLGQTLGHPPNVAGWNGGKNWIDANTLIFRLRLGDALLRSADLPETLQRDQAEDIPLGKKLKSYNTEIEWKHFEYMVGHNSGRRLNEAVATLLLVKPGDLPARLPEPADLPESISLILRSPEYQMC